MEGHCLTGQSLQWAVVPMEEEEEVASCWLLLNKPKKSQENTLSECCTMIKYH